MFFRKYLQPVADWTLAIGYLLLLFSVGFFRLACYHLKGAPADRD